MINYILCINGIYIYIYIYRPHRIQISTCTIMLSLSLVFSDLDDLGGMFINGVRELLVEVFTSSIS